VGGLERIRCFLDFLHSHTNRFFRERMSRERVANYEDLYYLVTQLADAVDGFENPAIAHFLEVAEKSFMTPALPRCASFWSSDLLDETRHYIRCGKLPSAGY